MDLSSTALTQGSDMPRDAVVDARDEIPELLTLVQRLPRLPALARCRRRKPNPHLGDRRQDRLAQRVAKIGLDLDLPDESGKHRNDIRGFHLSVAVLHHGSTRTRCRRHGRPARTAA
jgi:hypothetical protein